MRFGIVQAKVGLVSLLRDYRIRLHSKTKVPLMIEPSSFVTAAKGAVYVTLEEINKQSPAA